MSTVQNYFTQAELALAAYADLVTAEPNVAKLKDAGMSQVQADRFATQWRVIDQYSPVSSGLSATVFEEVSSGKRYLAIRGTTVAAATTSSKAETATTTLKVA